MTMTYSGKKRIWRQAMVAGMNHAVIKGVTNGEVEFKLFDLNAKAWVITPNGMLETYLVVSIPGRLSARGWFERSEGFWLQSQRYTIRSCIDCSTSDAAEWGEWELIEPIGFRDNGKYM